MSLTRARSPSSKNGLPDLRLLPDAPVPDGRTVLTSPDADRRAAGRGSRKASAAFHTRYQHRRELAHAGPQDDQNARTLPQRRRSTPTDLARDHARQDELANLLQLDASNGSPTHPLRRPHPRQHLTTHRYTEKRAGSTTFVDERRRAQQRLRWHLKRSSPGRGRGRSGSRSATRATARASIGSDLPRSLPVRRAIPVSFGGTRTSFSPAASSIGSSAPVTWRHPRAPRDAPRPAEPPKRATTARHTRASAPRAPARPHRQRPPSTTACVRPHQQRSSRSPPPTLGATGERTGLTRGSCQAPIRSRSTVSGRRRRHNTGKSAPTDMRESSQPPPPESLPLTGRHHDADDDSEFGNVP